MTHPVLSKHPVIGADWNHWRPVKDYKRLCQQIYFGIIKVSDGWKYPDGTRRDPDFEQNWRMLKQYGRARSPYHFLRLYRDSSRIRVQIEDFWRYLEATGDLGELPFCLDVEKIGWVETLTEQQARDCIWKALLVLEELSGRSHEETWIYTNLATWNERVATPPTGNTDIPRGTRGPRGLVVASWNNVRPSLPWDWTTRYGDDYPITAEVWQFTNVYPFEGFEKDRTADADVWVGGDLADFNRAYGLNLQPLTEPIPEPQPEPVPTLVQIVNLDLGEYLNVRDGKPWGTVRFKTWNGMQYPVHSVAYDSLDRAWYEIFPGLLVASWYTKRIA